MKKWVVIVWIGFSFCLHAQNEKKYFDADITYFQGTILKHNPDISHLITNHPEGMMLSLQQRTFGNKEWQRLYNYPDYGFTLIYQDLKNQSLGTNYSLYAHWNFYFLKRHLTLKIGQGIAYTTNPFDIDNNFRNVAYGSHLLSSTIAFLNFEKKNILKNLGVKAGLGIIHYSNANVKAPNKSTNTLTFQTGVTYSFQEDFPDYVAKEKGEVKSNKPLKFGFFYRGGVNETDVIGSGQYVFHTIGGFVDKKINKKSTLVAGTELFISEALKRFIEFRANAEFADSGTGDEDSKRVGIFLGHELTVNRVSLISQLGFYAYYPFDFEGRFYNRLGARYYFSNNWYASVTVRSHAAKAEAVEFTIGYKL
ncbi:acyloxyacyl hydrolase [Aquimarina sp. ERC-38]|nr:acyloxyacyl hydrolase [Aquimarina sp. ERC-38]